ncbi:uncharacterized protein BDZ99DRAFT_544976 [Mytilinidion resinicola]|uniref:AB hydrolase-1 domain-containing protein n=1 Tax=Mytilinidion resinicola TaxID=574789 RepID=A0A6A6Y6U7_9PEZI|nr:uncharacterized protein BDZ99DRAFT_544976 [Mytilinidion resinicola]KAF2804410.1 hypothetical protein BDZ99DRAFT_544976 [Mytilinidion resinicola]
MSPKPNLVFVPGSWHGPECYSKVVALLEPQGFNSAIQGFTSASAKGRVVGMVYMATGFNPAGVKMSFLGGLGGKPPPLWKMNEETGFAEIVVDSREMFYNNLPEDEGNALVAKLRKQSLASLTEASELAYAGWMDVPVWYLATVQDKGLPVEAQRMFVQMAKDAGGDVTLEEADSSHSVMLSKPKETAEFIVRAVAAFEGKKE